MAKRKISKVIAEAAVEADARVRQLLAANTKLKTALARDAANVDVVRGLLRDVYAVPSGLQRLNTTPRGKNKKYFETAVLHVTDTHYGKKTASYNVDVCADRTTQLFNATKEIVTLRRKSTNINKVVVLFGGDMGEGQAIFPGQEWETDANLVQQVFRGGPEIMVNLLLGLAEVFPEVEVNGVPGNHGRIQKMGVGSFNADSIVYEVIRGMVDKAKPKAEFTWNLPFDREPGIAWYAKTEVEGHGIVVIHGDFKGPGNQLGYPWYSIGRRVAQWAAVIGEFEYLYVGHNHTWASFESAGKIVLATGSMESDNSYAAKNFAACGEPHQRLSFYNRNHGLLADHRIYLK